MLYEQSSQRTVNFVWLADKLVGISVNHGSLQTVHTDWLGRPEIVTDSQSSTIVWRSSNASYDRIVSVDNIGGLNVFFPGQYYDSESNHFYNWHRYYDASSGRYLQSDPIGLGGGINTYAYVVGNPISRVDPVGLLSFIGGSGGNAVLGGSGGEATSGGYYNVETGQMGGFTSSGGGLNWMTSGQSGLFLGGGAFAGFVTGGVSNVEGGFINWNLAIPGTNFGLTVYFNSNGDWVGGAIGYGPGIGADRTTTNTTLYPSGKPCP